MPEQTRTSNIPDSTPFIRLRSGAFQPEMFGSRFRSVRLQSSAGYVPGLILGRARPSGADKAGREFVDMAKARAIYPADTTIHTGVNAAQAKETFRQAILAD
ncbi:hypothetical protein [Paenibacillus contaminans]|uniref:Uncharacterized protein n=1 Tax=Paenibacillus contaminans TaxID=450362 RepID=A0A329MKA9_9BACL|nr:hypothetical protein [Paenibacillus contaminans]RAV20082.1 hypothetical protein DQG23_16555 [Paenibacillus contaminans]